MELINYINNTGKGPGYFNGIFKSAFIDDYYLVLDDGNRRFNSYQNDVFIKTIPYAKYGILLNDFCLDEDHNIYLSTLNALTRNPIVKLDSNGHELLQFGTLNATYDFYGADHAEPRYLFMSKSGTLLAISEMYPVFEEYDLNGNLLNTADLGSYNFFSDYIEEIKNRIDQDPGLKSKNRVVDLFRDVSFYQDRLFLLLWEYQNGNKYRDCQKVAMVNVSDSGNIYLEAIFDLYSKDNTATRISYSSICGFGKNNLMAFELSSGRIEVFTIPDFNFGID
ncbi:MAG: hypothetical protein ACFHWX_18235 [Bacteroidota bacterium]